MTQFTGTQPTGTQPTETQPTGTQSTEILPSDQTSAPDHPPIEKPPLRFADLGVREEIVRALAEQGIEVVVDVYVGRVVTVWRKGRKT